MWVNWLLSTKLAVSELGVTHRAFYNHASYYNLMAKRTAKNPTNIFLMRAAELGMEAGGHTIQSGLRAMELLDKRRNEDKTRKVDHNVHGFIGTADMSKLSTQQLADLAAEVEKKLRILEREGTDDDTIDGEVVEEDDQRLLPPPPVSAPRPIRVNNRPARPGEEIVGQQRVRMKNGQRVHKPR